MILVWENDGAPYDAEKIEGMGFALNTLRDCRSVRTPYRAGDSGWTEERGAAEDAGWAEDSGWTEESGAAKEAGQAVGAVGDDADGGGADRRLVYDFVGFVTNGDDDLLAVFPKHFAVKDVEADAELVFQVINRHRQRFPEYYLGERYGESFRSNYPFAAFFGIYDYYQRFGVYVEERRFSREGADGKIDWRTTIRRASVYPAGGRAVLYPLYHRQTYVFSTFLTECMVFAIDYTLRKFGTFLGLAPTGLAFPEHDYLGEREAVVETLVRLREQVFRDELLLLIDHLTAFYSQVCEGGNLYWKCDIFAHIWEDMVTEYLRRTLGLPFAKKRFYPNGAAPEQYVEPDAYAVRGNCQYLYDAKYYTGPHGLDYKQLAYHFLLSGRRERETDGEPAYETTVSALVLPGETDERRLHFETAPLFCREGGRIRIWEEYLDIRKVMRSYADG